MDNLDHMISQAVGGVMSIQPQRNNTDYENN